MTENAGDQNVNNIPLNFDNTEIAFRNKTDEELNASYRLFKLINNNLLAKIGPSLVRIALKLGFPVTGFIKRTLFKQFCGGESI